LVTVAIADHFALLAHNVSIGRFQSLTAISQVPSWAANLQVVYRRAALPSTGFLPGIRLAECEISMSAKIVPQNQCT